MISLEDQIAKLCLDKYKSLKKTGKPSEKEWTVLSGIVLKNSLGEYSIITLCTGTKCLNGIELKSTKYRDRGNRLSDSHAEVLARRAFLRYLYYQIELICNDVESQIFFFEEGNIKLKNVSFHFFSSQTPCGDCSIIPMLKADNDASPPKKLKKENDDGIEYGIEISDIYRTGAKCIENDNRQDSRQTGVHYHVVGPLRTKPGRGDRTLSLSCSDKIAKWNVMGVQGALLSLMIPTVRFDSIVIGGDCPYSLEAMQRGLYKRFDSNIEAPSIMQSKLSFEHKKGISRMRPCPSSIVWCAVPEKEIEISVDGLKQGVTKKKNKSCSLLISRKELFKTFLKVYDKFCCDKKVPSHPKKLTYYHYKQSSSFYESLWKDKLQVFSSWPVKPLYLQECLSF